MTGQLLPKGKVQWTDANGFPLVGGEVYFYVPGTTTLKETWADSGLTVLNENPISLDERGEATVWTSGGTYRQIVYDATGVLIWDVVTAAPSATDLLGFTPVQQGGGTGQGNNKVYIGWTGSNLAATVDTTNLGNFVFESELQGDLTNINNEISSLNGQVSTLNGEMSNANNQIAQLGQEVTALQNAPQPAVIGNFFGGISANGSSNVTLPSGGTWLYWGANSVSGQDFSQNSGMMPQYDTGAAAIWGQAAGGATFSNIGIMIAIRIA
jgi:hypothetical protein